MSETLSLAKALINIQSITPNDNHCQIILIQRLKKMGFTITELHSNNVSNFFATHGNDHQHLFCFSGHTDVVPPGDLAEWHSPPFEATIRDKKLFGRGAADMKSALAAMIVATERFILKNPNHPGKIGFLITSDEEGAGIDGTIKIVDYLQNNKIKLDYCLIGEATSNKKLGDVIKVGRRGSLHGQLTVHGKQGHIAYPHLAINPIHRSFQALDHLTKIEWDQASDLFSPTSFQIYNINADTGANNIIPGSLTARFNFRYSPASTAESLQKQVEQVFEAHQLNYDIQWRHLSNPFHSKPGALTQACRDAILDICHITTEPNTTGGTSDGRFIATTGAEIVELGLLNDSIHHVNEHTNLTDLEKLTDLYENILEKIVLQA
ncbi:MAG: succinyl-diaminopimelate desuccinylase [Gammaproteobacteria bacterium CG_4_10_14_0_8_um_filter_38_16]|nr:MAG: succinyl-diaminopimelate desuccinylase [Gammaproteobacteria bacterium CG_4_10_14_0_8_um_filter_38_16]PJA03493.1 MAG: succinyl-diaminopimelate desuccinylase [Gammaproteobacteria bacterium CG_4_10_14_0_2_um_filter_38_22]PJB10871.1 MAG: succinyl-diaminopimelate desuccinylase [Gammaproteobacteria bacterium CG_4_9_14_3_um_filter_38_9]